MKPALHKRLNLLHNLHCCLTHSPYNDLQSHGKKSRARNNTLADTRVLFSCNHLSKITVLVSRLPSIRIGKETEESAQIQHCFNWQYLSGSSTPPNLVCTHFLLFQCRKLTEMTELLNEVGTKCLLDLMFFDVACQRFRQLEKDESNYKHL